MEKKMLVTQALDQRDLLVKKICDKIRKASFTETKKHNEEKVMERRVTQKEFEMLYVLLINKGIVLTRQKLLNMVWGEDYYGEERIVDTHIKNIRKKLGVNLISTIRGVGYRIDKEN